MWRAGAFLLFAVCAGAQTTTPYDLARYLSSHKATEWKSIWKMWGVPDKDTPACDDAIRKCSVDLITIMQPTQVVLVFQSWAFDHYLRFRTAGPTWRYGGSAGSFNKNYGRRYEITRIDEKPFLKTSGQGANGSNWDSELECWFDLSSEKFEPVFVFTPKGDESRMGFGVSRDIRAFASQGDQGAIEVDVEIRFSIFHEIDLGFARFKASYTQEGSGSKFTLHAIEPAGGAARPVSKEDFEKLVDINVDGGPSDAQLVQFAMPRLREIASARDLDTRKSLKEAIEFWEDSTAKRELLTLIHRN
jgi:hypothetical protein